MYNGTLKEILHFDLWEEWCWASHGVRISRQENQLDFGDVVMQLAWDLRRILEVISRGLSATLWIQILSLKGYRHDTS